MFTATHSSWSTVSLWPSEVSIIASPPRRNLNLVLGLAIVGALVGADVDNKLTKYVLLLQANDLRVTC